MFLERVTVFCFAASYGVAFLTELLQLLRPRPVLRLVGLGFGGAGLLAHTIFLAMHHPELASSYGSLLFLAWIVSLLSLRQPARLHDRLGPVCPAAGPRPHRVGRPVRRRLCPPARAVAGLAALAPRATILGGAARCPFAAGRGRGLRRLLCQCHV